MRAVRFRRYGGPEVLAVEDVPVPEPTDGELLVEVAAAGVTLPVLRLTRGTPDGGVPLPHVPGGDIAGRVAAVGPGVTGWRVGQRVAGLAFAGAYAEFAAVPTALVTAVPDGVDDAAALLLVRSGQLALATLRASDLGSGEGVLVTAAAGGVGHLAVQLAVALGAGRVVAAVGSAAKAEFVRGLGAGEVITYDAETWGDPVDVVLDGVGGDVQPRVLDALAPMGRLVAYHGAGGPVDVNALRMHARTVIGFAMAHFAAHRRDSYDRNQQELWDHYAAGRLRPVVHAILPLERAAEAHRLVESRANLGKVLLTP